MIARNKTTSAHIKTHIYLCINKTHSQNTQQIEHTKSQTRTRHQINTKVITRKKTHTIKQNKITNQK